MLQLLITKDSLSSRSHTRNYKRCVNLNQYWQNNFNSTHYFCARLRIIMRKVAGTLSLHPRWPCLKGFRSWEKVDLKIKEARKYVLKFRNFCDSLKIPGMSRVYNRNLRSFYSLIKNQMPQQQGIRAPMIYYAPWNSLGWYHFDFFTKT